MELGRIRRFDQNSYIPCIAALSRLACGTRAVGWAIKSSTIFTNRALRRRSPQSVSFSSSAAQLIDARLTFLTLCSSELTAIPYPWNPRHTKGASLFIHNCNPCRYPWDRSDSWIYLYLIYIYISNLSTSLSVYSPSTSRVQIFHARPQFSPFFTLWATTLSSL